MKIKKMLFTAMSIIVLVTSANAQNVNIPDANFKAALVGNANVNSNLDTEIQIVEASAFNGMIDVSGLGISDLTGIEAFVLLDSLDCSYNQLAALNVSACNSLTTLNCSYNYAITSLDVSANSLLTYLDCSSGYLTGGGWFPGQLASLDLSSNAALTYLNCYGNQLTSIDLFFNTVLTYIDCSNNLLADLNVSACTSLTTLNCYLNQLVGIDVSSNTALVYLDCNTNQLTSIDVSANPSLTTLNCSYNYAITSLDISANTSLAHLDCVSNQLTSLDLSSNAALTYLNCSYNYAITSLDLSSNTALTYLDCSYNQLANLNVKNGNNINMSDHSFFAIYNSNLTCIEVDNVPWSTTNWAGYFYVVEYFWPGTGDPYYEQFFQSNIDAQSFYSEDCSNIDVNNISQNVELMVYPNPTTGIVFMSKNSYLELTDLTGKILLQRNNTNQLDISSFSAGMYLLSVGGITQQVIKIIKE